MAQHDKRGKKPIILGLVAGLTLAGTGVAFAYWTSTGVGDGTAETGESVVFAISSEDAVGGPLTPGGATQTVDFTVTNPSTGYQSLAGVTISVATADGSPWAPATDCSAADYTAVITSPPETGPIAPNGSVDGQATISMIESGENQDGCQNLDVPLYFTATPVAN